VRSRRLDLPAPNDLKTTATSATSIQALDELLSPPRAPISGLHFVDRSSFLEPGAKELNPLTGRQL